MPADPTLSASRKEARSAPHKRTYQACKACRSAKLRCDLGDPDKPSDPPCKRCMRTGRQCVFGGVYQRRPSKEPSVVGELKGSPSLAGQETMRASKPDVGSTRDQYIPSSNTGNSGGRSGFADAFSTPYSTFRSSLPSALSNAGPSQPPRRNDEFKFVRGETLENPADALRILCAAVEEERPGDRASQESDLVVEPGRWNRWIPVRDGLLTADEASILLAFYGDKINPTLPLVPAQMFQPAYFGALLREPILLAAMIATAARFLDLGLSFDMNEPSRSRIIQGKIVAWLLQRIGFITMGETSSRTIGTVEAFLILSEWPPRAQYLFDSVVPQTGAAASSSKDTNPCKVYDDLSWTLIGLAVRIAQELELQNERTYINDEETEWVNHRRHNTWIYCLSADRHASVRLGRASLVQAKMSMNWWDVTSAFTKIPDDTTFPFPRSQLRWREAMGVAQLTHTVGLLQEMLYASPDVTNELIKTGRYESTLHRLKPELDANWHAQLGDLPPVSVFDSDGDTFTDEELMEIRWLIEFDYVRLYGNAIAMRAAQDRLLRRHKHNKALRTERMFEQNVIRLAEGSFVIEAVDAATSLVKCGVTMQKKGILRYCPCRTFMRLVFASVFLMKAVAFGAVGKPEQEVVDLQYQLISALRLSSPDDQHVSHHVSTLLSRVFPAMPQSNNTFNPLATPAGNQLSDTLSEDDLGHANNSFTSLPWLGLDMPNNDANPLDWSSGVVSGFGYDPSSIVSDIEEMLRAQEGSAGGHGFLT